MKTNMFTLWFYVVPFLVGIVLRVLLNRLKRPYLVTVVLGIVTLIAWCIAMFNAIPGSELTFILALPPTMAFVGSFVIEVVFNFWGIY